jgi:hypothetical protein
MGEIRSKSMEAEKCIKILVAGTNGIGNLRGLSVDSSIIFKCVMVLGMNVSELG